MTAKKFRGKDLISSKCHYSSSFNYLIQLTNTWVRIAHRDYLPSTSCINIQTGIDRYK